MLARLSWPALTMTAGTLGMATGVMMLLLKKEREEHLNNHPFIHRAVDMVRKEPIATDLLGDFIVGRASLSNGFTKIRSDDIQVSIPLKGKKDNASLLIYAYRQPDTDPEKPGKMKIWKLEMAFAKIEDKRLVLLDEGIKPIEPPKPEPKPLPEDITQLDKDDLKKADVNTRAEYMVKMALKVDPEIMMKQTVSYKLDDILESSEGKEKR